ncbi:MAG: hypothetical protein JSR18_04110 [Proteobacteria bacterium]|nr:hypothetical protein [Pseudomonadota bacterium]
MRTLLAAALAATLAVLAACGNLTASTHLVGSEGEATRMYRVVAIVPMDGTPEERKVFEDALATRFAAHGVKAPTATNLSAQVLSVDGGSIIRNLKAQGAEAVLYVRLMRDKPDTKLDKSVGNWGWTGQAASWYPPPGNQAAALGHFEAQLYDLTGNKEVWFGKTLTFYPKSAAVDAPDIATQIVGALATKGFIPKT